MGTLDQFCEGLFHVFPTPELDMEGHGCLSGEKRDICRPFAMTLVVRTDRDFVARYTNCRNMHAEEFWTKSKLFREHLANAKPSSVHLFMKNHPCHHSSGNARRYPDGYMFNGNADQRSCTEVVIDFFGNVLRPANVSLHIHVSSLYKAFWKHAKRNDDYETSKNSLLGLQLLLRANIYIDCIYMHHWLLLANLCHDSLKLENILTAKRLTTDMFVGRFIQEQRTKIAT